MTGPSKLKLQIGKAWIIGAVALIGIGAIGSFNKSGEAVDPEPMVKAENPGQAASIFQKGLSAPLNEVAQQERFEACMARLEHYRNMRVWVHGGVKPGVARGGWDQLTDAEKSEVFDIAGCISTGGQVSEIMVTVAEEGNGPEIETRRVANDRNFAAEVK